MSHLPLRTIAEAHVYMDQRPCRCRDVAFPRQTAELTRDGVGCVRFFGPCRTCSTVREFFFDLPRDVYPESSVLTFGGREPSRLLDGGEWLAISDGALRRAPRKPARFDVACAALEEVLKFLPDGAPQLPDSAFWTERGRAVRDREPDRFRRDRLASSLEERRALLAREPLTEIAIVWKHTGDAEFPFTAEVRGRRYTIRINDFPAEPLYTLLAGDDELGDIDDWPPLWDRPNPPQQLLDLLRPRTPPAT